MNSTIEQMYQDIGRESLALASDLTGKLLVYAEVEEGAISADMFYVCSPSGVVRFRFCPRSLLALIQTLWERWQEHPENREWRVMCYVIDGGKFSIDLVYPDQVDEDEDVSDRRPLAVKKYFGDAKVDYSNP